LIPGLDAIGQYTWGCNQPPVGGLEYFLFSPIVGMLIQSDELIFFREVQTTNQTMSMENFGFNRNVICTWRYFSGSNGIELK
jgi:hypothetical protein